MRPLLWQPSVALSAQEERILKRIRKAKLFVLLREYCNVALLSTIYTFWPVLRLFRLSFKQQLDFLTGALDYKIYRSKAGISSVQKARNERIYL